MRITGDRHCTMKVILHSCVQCELHITKKSHKLFYTCCFQLLLNTGKCIMYKIYIYIYTHIHTHTHTHTYTYTYTHTHTYIYTYIHIQWGKKTKIQKNWFKKKMYILICNLMSEISIWSPVNQQDVWLPGVF